MNVKELADYACLSRQTIYNLVNTKKIPFTRISEKKVLFDKNEIDEWLDHRAKRKTGTHRCKRGKDVLKNRVDSQAIKKFPKSKLVYAYFLILILVVFFGWAGSFLYFKSRVRSFDHNDSSAESFDLGSLIEGGKLGRIEVNIPYLNEEKVQIYLDHISDVEVRGKATSSSVKTLLIQTLRSGKDDYALKSKTIDVIKPYTNDREIREALISVAKNEADPVIRMKALTVLAKVAGVEEVKAVLLDRLIKDDNIGIRFKSLEIIEKVLDEGIIIVLKRLIKEEQNDVIKAKAEAIYHNYIRAKL